MKKAPWILMAALAAPLGGDVSAQTTADFAGRWLGAMDAGGTTLRMLFELTEAGSELSAAVFSVDQGNAQIPVASTEVNGSTLSVSMPAVGGSYEGNLSTDGSTIDGTFTQGGNALALVLERTEEDPTPPRPQDPVEPLPYHAEDVTYPNPEGGHTLAGTFTRPSTGGPFPTVILISGSGPQNRDEALLGHRPFLVLSDHLTRNGIAVLRFDDRGVGESTGDFATATSRDHASDVRAGIAYLLSRSDVDASKIGLAGHSEGGLIAPMVAVESDDVSYIVLMAGPGVTGEAILYEQGALIAEADGATEEQMERARAQQEAVYAVLKNEPDPEAAAAALGDLMRAQFEQGTEEELAQLGITDEASLERAVRSSVATVNSPWFRYFLTYDPATSLEKVTVPVLAINGEKDLQVPYELNLREIEAALARGGNTTVRIQALPDLNHLFQHAETGSPSEYQQIEETFDVETMELITGWILQTVGAGRAMPDLDRSP